MKFCCFIATKITDLREDSVACDGTRSVPTTVRTINDWEKFCCFDPAC